jgi:amidase
MPIAIAVTPRAVDSPSLFLKPTPEVDGASSPLDPKPRPPTTLPVAQWQVLAEKKRFQREQAIPTAWRLPAGSVPEGSLSVVDVPEECGLLSPRELEITGTDAEVLLRKLVDREYSSYEVSRAASCRVVSCRVVSCRVVSCRVVSCRVGVAARIRP